MTSATTRGATQGLLSPSDAGWAKVAESRLVLKPTPLESQPSAYVQKAWAGRKRGKIGAVVVKATQSSGTLYVRLQWAAPDPRLKITDNNVYADACALLFPANGKDAEISTMGSPEKPVTTWYWRAGAEAPFAGTATGIGTVAREERHSVKASGEWLAGQWQVVLSGPAPGTRVAVAVWSGAADERAGIKSHTPSWTDLRVG